MAGFSKTRLGRMREVMSGYVERHEIPGIVTVVSRRGETHVEAVGTLAFDDEALMRRDSIFRIASVTKPIVAVAAMILVEECVLRLDDPVDLWLPELADRRVLRSIESPLDDTVPANRPIMLRDLLTLRLGYGAIMVFPSQHPIQFAMEEAGLAPGPNLPTFSANGLMERYGSLPLVHQPGEQWLYNSGSDILGVLIARASGKRLGEFLQERIFEPLRMKDTGFSVPASERHRLPSFYGRSFETGQLERIDGNDETSLFANPPAFESGAGGLVSTADDLLAFAEMMLNQGTYKNERILSRPSVELMTTDQITPEQKAASPFVPGFWDNRGWGFGLSVMTRRDDIWSIPGRYGWEGGYGTSWYVDPKEELIGVLLTPRLFADPSGPTVLSNFWTTAYQAIAD